MGSTNAGIARLEWNGVLEWLARFKFPVVVFFFILSNRVSMASHTEKQVLL